MISPIFLVEAALNGVLLAGVLALLALGLNLIFGVLDIVWIAYVDLVAVCMYAVYFLVTAYGWPLVAAGGAPGGGRAHPGDTGHIQVNSPHITHHHADRRAAAQRHPHNLARKKDI